MLTSLLAGQQGRADAGNRSIPGAVDAAFYSMERTVDRAEAKISIGRRHGFDSGRGEKYVIEVDYSRSDGGSAYYTLGGQYLAG